LKVGLTLDAGALIALDRNDRRVISMLARLEENNWPVTIPATAFAQAIRHPARQARVRRLIGSPTTNFMPLNESDATAVGLLLAVTGTADIADAHVVVCARRADQSVVTTDPDDIRRLDAELDLFVL
jgi:hypothetical protein